MIKRAITFVISRKFNLCRLTYSVKDFMNILFNKINILCKVDKYEVKGNIVEIAGYICFENLNIFSDDKINIDIFFINTCSKKIIYPIQNNFFIVTKKSDLVEYYTFDVKIKFDNISDKFDLIANYTINNMNISRKIYIPKKYLDKYIGTKYENFILNITNYKNNVFNIRKCEIKNNLIKNILG